MPFLLLLLMVPMLASGQHLSPFGPPSGTASAGLNRSDLWSIAYNQAGLAPIKSVSAGIAAGSPFLLNELKSGAFLLCLPSRLGCFGLAMQTRGFALNSKRKIGIAYGQSLGKGIRVGVRINYQAQRFGEGYGTEKTVSGEGGFQFDLNPKIMLAGHLKDPGQPSALLRSGIAYTISQKLMTLAEIWKPIVGSASVRAGCAYTPIEKFTLLFGFDSTQATFSAGFSYRSSGIDLTLTTSHHPNLGFSPQISLSWDAK